MREIETQPAGLDERTLLRDMAAEDLPQGLVEKMCGGMMLPVAAAAQVIDLKLRGIAEPDAVLLDHADMDDEIANPPLGVLDPEFGARRGSDDPVIAGLAARLAIERRLVEQQRTALALLKPRRFASIDDDRLEHALGLLGLVAQELASPSAFFDIEPDRLGPGFARALPGLAGFLALLRHGDIELSSVDRDAARL